MIGRYTTVGVVAEIGWRRVSMLALAALLVALSAVTQFVVHSPRWTVGLSLASLSLTGFPIIWRAIQGLIRLQTNVDELVSLAIVASLVLGEWLSAAVVALIMVTGALVEELVSARSRRHLEALFAAAPRDALRLEPDGSTSLVPIGELVPGTRIVVRPGDVIAADGVVETGESRVDESLLTGESAPADKAPGDAVSSGTINESGSLTVRVERTGELSAHGKVLQLIRDAEGHRAPILRAAESYARWFTPGVLTLAGAVLAVTGEPHRAVAVLIVGCPCAFVLATPTAIVAALSRAARSGLLIKGGRYLEGCAQVNALAFDKTGTLTSGECRVAEIVTVDGVTRSELLAEAARLESSADHPLARAVLARATTEGVSVPRGSAIEREAGLGIVERTAAGRDGWRLGNARFMTRHGVAVAPLEAAAGELRRRGLSVIYVAHGPTLKGLLAIEDDVRPEAASVIRTLREEGLHDIRVLTGDAEAVAHAVAGRVGLAPEQMHAELLPAQKYERVCDLQRDGRHVAYVGDGANDGPALSVATVGVSLGSRHNTVALETASVVLMRNSLDGLPFLFRLGRATSRTINQNLVLFGLIFNAAMLALSSGGFLTPVLGALAHNVGSIAVVLNSARLLYFEREAGT